MPPLLWAVFLCVTATGDLWHSASWTFIYNSSVLTGNTRVMGAKYILEDYGARTRGEDERMAKT